MQDQALADVFRVACLLLLQRRMPSNPGRVGSGTFLVDLMATDDAWRQLAETGVGARERSSGLPPLTNRDARPPSFPAVDTTTDGYEKVARVRQKSAGFVHEVPRLGTREPSQTADLYDPWQTSERRLWMIAGSLMGLAIGVLTLFAMLNLGDRTIGATQLATTTPVAPIPGAPEFTAPPPKAATPTATATQAAPSGNAFRPPLPARVRSAEPKPQAPMAHKHQKRHKGKKLARN
jgi:hypothetical protein